jgi:hypothetical protein
MYQIEAKNDGLFIYHMKNSRKGQFDKNLSKQAKKDNQEISSSNRNLLSGKT